MRPRTGIVVAGAALACSCGLMTREVEHPGKFLVDVASEKPEGDYREVATVGCSAPKESDASEKRCHDDLRIQGLGAGADLVVVEKVENRGDSIAMTGTAYQRVLPWQREPVPDAPATTTRAMAKPASLGSGTGFAVRPDGTILTAHHVVEGARSVHVTLASGAQAVARVAQRNAESDLAVLEVPEATPDYLPLGTSDDTSVGGAVWTVGYPVVGLLGIEPKFTDGSVSSMTGLGGEETVYQVTVPIQPGNSGGPLVTDAGVAIGVITSTAAVKEFFEATGTLPQGINWAVKAERAKGLFEPPEQLPKTESRKAAVQRAKAAVCLVESVEGDGLLLAPNGFGQELAPKTITPAAYATLRGKCDADDPEACLSVARVLVEECAKKRAGPCRDARYATTMLAHACSVGRTIACAPLRR